MKKQSTPQLLAAIALSAILPMGAHAATVTWDGSEADNDWNNSANWDGNAVPVAGDDVFITDGSSVTATEFNGSYTINLSGGSSLIDPTTSIAGGVLRLGSTTVNIGAGSTFGGGSFLDLSGGTINFVDGSSVNASFWEHKGTNAFNFELSGSGFTSINAGNLLLGGGATMADASYTVNADAFKGIGTLTLMSFSNNAITDSDFQTATLDVQNLDGGRDWELVYDSGNVNLVVTTAVPEPATTSLLGLGALALFVRRKR
ncbi:PEP-CTERM sorting domain-containing protein [Rubritalea marina]|uniref:PEP-CTERM sorting domain-containing protein n=1 Tax=Rubritalea marina TaxID=361055 RepID=UPI000371AC50|nr:PEP-CTERM sorting domain-containing protein [Rubritalea marina]